MRKKPAIEVTKEDIEIVKDYLCGYRFNGKLLRLDKYEKRYFGGKDVCDFESIGEIPLARARMYGIRHFIMSLENSDEKIFLYYHYVKGLCVENCGELLGIGRSSAFRMKKRALEIAAAEYKLKLANGENGNMFTASTQ